jgi:hypothetical protein
MDGAVIQGQRVITLEIILTLMILSGLAMAIVTGQDSGFQQGLVVGYIVRTTQVHGAIMPVIMVEQLILNQYNPRKNETPFSMYYN